MSTAAWPSAAGLFAPANSRAHVRTSVRAVRNAVRGFGPEAAKPLPDSSPANRPPPWEAIGTCRLGVWPVPGADSEGRRSPPVPAPS